MEDKKLNFLNYSFDKADLLFAVLLVFILFTSNNLISEFKQIPSPPYGGDNYNGLGGVIHILDGGNILDSSQMKGEVP